MKSSTSRKRLIREVGKMLAATRKRKKLSMGHIAETLQVSRSTIHNVEHGLIASHFDCVVAYARTLGDRAVMDLNKLVASFRLL